MSLPPPSGSDIVFFAITAVATESSPKEGRIIREARQTAYQICSGCEKQCG